jgi:hypothetical protein
VAIVGIIAAVIAGILELTSQHLVFVIWLVLLAIVLIGAEVALIWNRTGRYNRTGPVA